MKRMAMSELRRWRRTQRRAVWPALLATLLTQDNTGAVAQYITLPN